jgi:hypothetical protein
MVRKCERRVQSSERGSDFEKSVNIP